MAREPMDESPLNDSFVYCDDKYGCWCLVNFDNTVRCECRSCHHGKVDQNTAGYRRRRWDGSERPRG